MAVFIDMEMRGDDEALDAVDRLGEGLERNRRMLAAMNEESYRQGFILRDFATEQIRLEQETARRREAMTAETFETWIGHATEASEWTRRAFTMAIGAVGAGIADELVDGTHDWQTALKGVLKQMIAVTAQMVIMRSLMTVLTGGSAGWIGFLHGGGRVMHAGGAVRAHGGLDVMGDEVPIIAQRGEFVLRRRAAEEIGAANLQMLNRGATPTAPSYQFNISVQAQAVEDAARLARRLGPEIVSYLRGESQRGVLVLG